MLPHTKVTLQSRLLELTAVIIFHPQFVHAIPLLSQLVLVVALLNFPAHLHFNGHFLAESVLLGSFLSIFLGKPVEKNSTVYTTC